MATRSCSAPAARAEQHEPCQPKEPRLVTFASDRVGLATVQARAGFDPLEAYCSALLIALAGYAILGKGFRLSRRSAAVRRRDDVGARPGGDLSNRLWVRTLHDRSEYSPGRDYGGLRIPCAYIIRDLRRRRDPRQRHHPLWLLRLHSDGACSAKTGKTVPGGQGIRRLCLDLRDHRRLVVVPFVGTCRLRAGLAAARFSHASHTTGRIGRASRRHRNIRVARPTEVQPAMDPDAVRQHHVG